MLSMEKCVDYNNSQLGKYTLLNFNNCFLWMGSKNVITHNITKNVYTHVLKSVSNDKFCSAYEIMKLSKFQTVQKHLAKDENILWQFCQYNINNWQLFLYNFGFFVHSFIYKPRPKENKKKMLLKLIDTFSKASEWILVIWLTFFIYIFICVYLKNIYNEVISIVFSEINIQI